MKNEINTINQKAASRRQRILLRQNDGNENIQAAFTLGAITTMIVGAIIFAALAI